MVETDDTDDSLEDFYTMTSNMSEVQVFSGKKVSELTDDEELILKVPPIGYLDILWVKSTVDFSRYMSIFRRYVSTFVEVRRLLSKNVDFCK